jgi:hypothetical protein
MRVGSYFNGVVIVATVRWGGSGHFNGMCHPSRPMRYRMRTQMPTPAVCVLEGAAAQALATPPGGQEQDPLAFEAVGGRL